MATKQCRRDEVRSCGCRALTARNPNAIASSELSYFIGIRIHQTKIRIRLPKQLLKTLQRRNHKRNESENAASNASPTRNKKKWTKSVKLLPKKAGRMLSNVFGNRRSPDMCFSGAGKYGGRRKETEISNEDELDQQVRLDPESPMPPSRALKEHLKIDDEMGKQRRLANAKRAHPSRMVNKQSTKASLSLSRILNKKNDMIRIKDKTFKACSSANISANGINTSYRSGARDSASNSSNNVILKGTTLGSRVRVPNTGKKMREKMSMQKKVRKMVEKEAKQEEDEGEEGGVAEELCKKRILLGEKCKSLNVSGKLHYDKNGILVPEEIFS